jgi:hypothetical protein
MNWRRGLFRLWAVSSIIWVIFTVIFVSEGIDANTLPHFWPKEHVGEFERYLTNWTETRFSGILELCKNDERCFDDAKWRRGGNRVIDIATIAVAPPILLLVFGLSLGWVISGFRERSPP